MKVGMNANTNQTYKTKKQKRQSHKQYIIITAFAFLHYELENFKNSIFPFITYSLLWYGLKFHLQTGASPRGGLGGALATPSKTAKYW